MPFVFFLILLLPVLPTSSVVNSSIRDFFEFITPHSILCLLHAQLPLSYPSSGPPFVPIDGLSNSDNFRILILYAINQ